MRPAHQGCFENSAKAKSWDTDEHWGACRAQRCALRAGTAPARLSPVDPWKSTLIRVRNVRLIHQNDLFHAPWLRRRRMGDCPENSLAARKSISKIDCGPEYPSWSWREKK
jgi:hypothetical protein